MQTLLGKFFKPVNSDTRSEYHNFQFEKERAESTKRAREEEQRELEDLREHASRLEAREQQRAEAKRRAHEEEKQGRKKRQDALYEGVQIVEGLYLGGRLAAQNWDWLQTSGVQCVVNVTADVQHYYEHEQTFAYHRFAIEDDANAAMDVVLKPAAQLVASVLAEGKKCLVHCREGLSRSPSVVVAYLMIHCSLSLADALSLCEEKRGMLRINEGFLRTLTNLDRELFCSESTTIFDPTTRTERVSYDDMTALERKQLEEAEARKNRPKKKKPLTLQQFIEMQSKKILERNATTPMIVQQEQAASNNNNDNNNNNVEQSGI